MTSIEQVIQREPNPFDTETFWSGNFWQESQNSDLTVYSIHYEALAQTEEILDRVAGDRRTRTLMLEGETGSGKTYLLGRMKRMLNPKAFFAYIEPFTASDYIWRHILRYTVDSLLEIPEGKKESQLLLWLQGLSTMQQRSFMDRIRGEKQVFVRKLLEEYPTGIYNAQEFFGVLYNLTNPRLYNLACEWLRGDDLDDESLQKLGVHNAIESEDAAQKMLANFGRISTATQPIVLCFDQLDNIARQSDGSIDLPALFRVNSVIHTQKLKNFLIIISIITDTWRQHSGQILATDRDRIDTLVQLKQINLDQAEALWASRLYLLHSQTYPQPMSPIYPLTREQLESRFPGGKTRPRNTLMLGRQFMQALKMGALHQEIKAASPQPLLPASVEAIEVTEMSPISPKLAVSRVGMNGTRLEPIAIDRHIDEIDTLAAFKLVWFRKFKQTQQRITRIRQYATPELIQMLGEAIAAARSTEIQFRLLPSKTYASYSLSYQLPGQSKRIGVVWTEDLNLVKFHNFLKACEEAIEHKSCQILQLIRSEGVGSTPNRGYQLYTKLFTDSPHNHWIPELTSVHYLVTYHTLVNDALSGELVIGDCTPNLAELEGLMRESKILKNCPLLQQLGIFVGLVEDADAIAFSTEVSEVSDFAINRAIDQQCIALERLTQEILTQFSEMEELQVHQLLQNLCQQHPQVKLLNAEESVAEQIIYWVKA
jgi:hypothetical protein